MGSVIFYLDFLFQSKSASSCGLCQTYLGISRQGLGLGCATSCICQDLPFL